MSIDFQQCKFQNGRQAAILDFLVSGLTLVWLWISTPNLSGTMLIYKGKSLLIFSGYLVATLDFSVSRRHGFGSITHIFFGISVSNFMCMSFVAVGRSLMIVSYVDFKMAALWVWTMFNCNPPFAHCHPLLWGGGILVDHWSTISSFPWLLYRIQLLCSMQLAPISKSSVVWFFPYIPLLSNQFSMIHGSRVTCEKLFCLHFIPTLMTLCDIWKGQALLHGKNSVGKIIARRVIFNKPLIN